MSLRVLAGFETEELVYAHHVARESEHSDILISAP